MAMGHGGKGQRKRKSRKMNFEAKECIRAVVLVLKSAEYAPCAYYMDIRALYTTTTKPPKCALTCQGDLVADHEHNHMPDSA